MAKTKTIAGSNMNAMPKPKKYNKKKSGEAMLPVENISKKITVFNTKIAHELSLATWIRFRFLFRAEVIRYKKIRNPRVCTV